MSFLTLREIDSSASVFEILFEYLSHQNLAKWLKVSPELLFSCFPGQSQHDQVRTLAPLHPLALPSALPNIYTTLGPDYDDRVLPSITNEVMIYNFFALKHF